jgi:fructose/tagatose bisphosphate aldolase
MTFNYKHMPQACRITYGKNPKEGFLSNLSHLNILCGSDSSTYSNVVVLPHLDHADPHRDVWALTEGSKYLASAMFDAQTYDFAYNISMTADYVRNYGKDILIEGIMEQLTVEGAAKASKHDDTYVEKAVDYLSKTGIDFLVADLGTEQQSSEAGHCVYLQERAQKLTVALGRPMLVMHGTSCLNDEQMSSLASDGIIRVNMWTRIAREAGLYAAEKLEERIGHPDFDAVESHQYLMDSIEKAAEIMENTLEILGYANLG